MRGAVVVVSQTTLTSVAIARLREDTRQRILGLRMTTYEILKT